MMRLSENKGKPIHTAQILIIVTALWSFGAPRIYAQQSQPKTDTHKATGTPVAAQPHAPSKPQEIFMALDSGDLAFFGTLLASGANPNVRDPKSGRTLLMNTDKAAMVQLLIAHGADPTLKDNQGATALHYAVTSSDALKIIPQLLAKGADINARAQGWSQETPFMAAKKLFFQHNANYGAKVMQLLAKNGADINVADEIGYTVLISAVVNDKPELVRLMIELGADINHIAHDGLTAMAWAQELGFVDIIELLEMAQQ